MSVKARSELITSIPATDRSDEVPTIATAGLYRLYKRRWLGVFAMVGTTFFRMGLHVNTLCHG
jgi:hypothetical protein